MTEGATRTTPAVLSAQLDLVFCITCKVDTIPVGTSQVCGFCDRDPTTGILDPVESRQQWEYRQRARNVASAKAYRDTKSAA